MADYLIGKCFHVRNKGIDSLMCVESSLNVGWYYICRRLIKSTVGVGYFSDTDLLHTDNTDLVEVDPIIWSKIHKILRMNTIACNTIIQSYKEYGSFTGYYLSIFPNKTRYKLVEVLKDSQILTRFSDNQVRIVELKEDAVKFETMFSTGRKWIPSEVYHKVKDNVTNTIKQIDDIWTSM